MSSFRTRVYLITPENPDIDTFLPRLDDALSGGDVACLLVDMEIPDDSRWEKTIQAIAAVAQPRDVAVLVRNESRIASRSGADGIHLDGGIDAARDAMDRLSNTNLIVGSGGIGTRDNAMRIGETGIDYLFFGRLDIPERESAHEKMLDLAAWWAELFDPPCVVMAGTDLGSLEPIARAGIEFAALRAAVWDSPDCPGAVVREANRMLDSFGLPPQVERR